MPSARTVARMVVPLWAQASLVPQDQQNDEKHDQTNDTDKQDI